MKIIRTIALCVLFIFWIISSNISSGLHADIEREIYIACSLEVLIMPPGHSFSPAAEAQLLFWIDVSTAKLKKARHSIFVLQSSRRESIDDALMRLDKCKSKLTKDISSNKTKEAIASPEAGQAQPHR